MTWCHYSTQTKDSDGDTLSFLHVQTLRNFPREKLAGEVVAVRLDSTLIHNTSPLKDGSANKALHTIKYLHDAGAKVLLLSSWDYSSNPDLLSIDSFAGWFCLTSLIIFSSIISTMVFLDPYV